MEVFDKDYYQVLGLSQGASEEDIKKAYKRLALECHPDHHPEDPVLEDRFKRVTEAYSILGDLEKRRDYDLRSRGMGNREIAFGQSAEEMFLHFVAQEGFDIRKASCISGIRGCRRRNPATKDPAYEVLLTPLEAAHGARKQIVLPSRGGPRKRIFSIPPGVTSGTQFTLFLDRGGRESVLLTIKIADRDGELPEYPIYQDTN